MFLAEGGWQLMIVPIVEEEQWLDALADLPSFAVTASRILLVSPHPDDETLGAGAFLAAQSARGAEVVIAAVTDGENAYSENEGLAALRTQEQTSALAQLGVPVENIHRFRLTDSGLDAERHELVDLLTPLVTADTVVMAPWTGDYHPDHKVCGWAAEKVAQQAGAKLAWYFFWTWHRGTPADLCALDLAAFTFDDSLLQKKQRALACHASQLDRADGQPILPANLLGPAKRRFEVFAWA
jgi:LmbE family N-acetylglucosaminyl deacetylase